MHKMWTQMVLHRKNDKILQLPKLQKRSIIKNHRAIKMENNELIKQITELPCLIKQQHAKLLTHISIVESIKQQQKRYEDGFLIRINETCEKSNEKLRQAKINDQLRINEEYQRLCYSLQITEAELNNAKLELEFLENTFSACKAITRITEID